MTLEEACAACSGTVAPGQRLSVTVTRIVYDGETIRVLRDQVAMGLIDGDRELLDNLGVGTVRWVAQLQLPQAGSTLQVMAGGRTIEEAQAALGEAIAEALAEEDRAVMS